MPVVLVVLPLVVELVVDVFLVAAVGVGTVVDSVRPVEPVSPTTVLDESRTSGPVCADFGFFALAVAVVGVGPVVDSDFLASTGSEARAVGFGAPGSVVGATVGCCGTRSLTNLVTPSPTD